MPVIWNPTGQLDVATDPADLPMQGDGKTITSGAMTRCTNLQLDRQGIASTRRGSARVGAAMPEENISRIIEQGGMRYCFNGSSIYKNETSIAAGLTEAEWSAILYNPYNSLTQEVYALNGTDRQVIDGGEVREWGVDGPEDAPLLNPGWYTGQDWEAEYLTSAAKFTTTDDAGVYEAVFDWEVLYLNGDTLVADTDAYKYLYPFEIDILAYLQSSVVYSFEYTYLRKKGAVVEFESNPSPAASITVVDGTIPVRVMWTDSPDPQITHVRVYRTLPDGANYYHDLDYATGVTQGFSYQEEAALGTECNWFNHDRPPLGTKVLGPNFGGTCFILKDNLLYFSLPNQPEYWPESYYIEIAPVQFPCQAATFMDGQLFVATANEIYAIQGSGAASFFPLPMSAITGTVAPEVFEAIKGFGIIHLGNDGLYQYSGGKDQKISYAFEPIFWGETKGSIPGLNRDYLHNCILKAYNAKFYFGYPGGNSEYPDNFLVWDLSKDRVQHYQYSVVLRTLAEDHLNKRLLAGDTAGQIWEIEKYGAVDDAGTAIAWDVQGGEYSHLRKYFPRYAKYDVAVGTGATATGSILLDGVNQQSHVLTGNRLTKKRLVKGCTGDRLAMRLYGTGQVDIYGIEIE